MRSLPLTAGDYAIAASVAFHTTASFPDALRAERGLAELRRLRGVRRLPSGAGALRERLIEELAAQRRERPREFMILTARACMPASCWGTYRRVAVLEVEAGTHPAMISERAVGVYRVVQEWGPCNVGTTERCAYERALSEAYELIDRLRCLQ